MSGPLVDSPFSTAVNHTSSLTEAIRPLLYSRPPSSNSSGSCVCFSTGPPFISCLFFVPYGFIHTHSLFPAFPYTSQVMPKVLNLKLISNFKCNFKIIMHCKFMMFMSKCITFLILSAPVRRYRPVACPFCVLCCFSCMLFKIKFDLVLGSWALFLQLFF